MANGWGCAKLTLRMALKGDLKSINLANVLQDIASNELSGTLTLTAGDNRRLFWFEKGRLRLVGLGAGKGPAPLNGLLALGKVRAADINPKGGNLTLVRGMVKRGSIGKDDVRAALEQQMTEFVCDVFVWSEATFEFAEGEPDEDDFETSQLDHEIRMAADPIIIEALRRVDEWSEIRKSVVSAEQILIALRDRPVPDGDATVERVAAFFDGERRLRDIIDQTHLGTFVVLKAAAALLRAGAVRALTVKEALDRGRAAAQKKQHAQALRMARFALEREPANPDPRALAAESLEALGRADEAASEYRQLAAVQIEHGQRQEAVTTYRKIVALAPRDTFAQERLFALFVELARKAEALQQGEALAAAYKRAGLPDKAREMYAKLIQAFGDDDDLLESAGELARRLGDKKDALALYRRLFERALARGDNDAIVQHARTILRLDPAAEDVAKRRMEVETGVYRKRQVLRRRVRVIVGLSLFLLVLVGGGSYELRARTMLAQVRGEGSQLLQQKEFEKLLRRYNEFLGEFGWSLAVADAQRERNDHEESYIKHKLPKPEEVPEEGLLEAIAAVQEVKGLLTQQALKDRADAARARLVQRTGEVGNKYIEEAARLGREGTPAALERIAQMTHPLALEAVRQAAANEKADVRRAAVKALVGHKSDDALETLVTRLAVEPDAAVRTSVRKGLEERTGQTLGDDANRWMEWLRKELAQRAPQRVPPLLPTLTGGRAKIEAGQPVEVEWRLTATAPVDFSFTPELSVTDVKSKAVPVRVPAGAPRRVQLRPGEYVGARVDLTALGLVEPGLYYVEWSAMVGWGGDGGVKVPALPLTLELTPRK